MAPARSWADPSRMPEAQTIHSWPKTPRPGDISALVAREEGHMPKYVIERMPGRRALGALTPVLVAILAWLVAAPAALATPGRGRSAATITASFADSCRAFAAHSSKDISHVEFHYVDGRVVKDESISSHDYAIDGGAGDEIEFAIVKSGTTSEPRARARATR